jgi:hypothetical protein
VKILYLDESGDHSLSVIDSQYPVFVLGGVIVDAGYAEADMDAAVRRLKIEVFARSDITLHTGDIIRQRGPFASLIDPGRRRLFHDRLNALLQQLDYTVVACAIRKDAHLAAYGAAALDPYALSLNVLVERFCFALADTGETQPGVVIAECRDRTLDSALMASWHHLRERGTAYLRPQAIRDRVAHLRLERKHVVAKLLAQTAHRHQIDLGAEQFLEPLTQSEHAKVAELSLRLVVDQDVDVAILLRLVAGDGAEDGEPANAELGVVRIVRSQDPQYIISSHQSVLLAAVCRTGSPEREQREGGRDRRRT